MRLRGGVFLPSIQSIPSHASHSVPYATQRRPRVAGFCGESDWPHIVCLMRLRGGRQFQERRDAFLEPHIVCLMRLRGGHRYPPPSVQGCKPHIVCLMRLRGGRRFYCVLQDNPASHSVPYATQRRGGNTSSNTKPTCLT